MRGLSFVVAFISLCLFGVGMVEATQGVVVARVRQPLFPRRAVVVAPVQHIQQVQVQKVQAVRVQQVVQPVQIQHVVVPQQIRVQAVQQYVAPVQVQQYVAPVQAVQAGCADFF